MKDDNFWIDMAAIKYIFSDLKIKRKDFYTFKEMFIFMIVCFTISIILYLLSR